MMAAADPGIVFVGDPHGRWQMIEAGVAALPVLPRAAILLGDIECDEPLDVLATPFLRRGIAVFWIAGNHDFDGGIGMWANLTDPQCNPMTHAGALHCRVIDIGGVRVAGLSGTFRAPIWHPPAPPRCRSRAELADALPGIGAGWRSGDLALLSSSLAGTAIWPDDLERLACLRADILVAHEAPGSHPAGFAAIEQLGRRMGAALLVHGHHHVTYRAMAEDGLRVLGVASAWGVTAQGHVAWRGETPRSPFALASGWHVEDRVCATM